MFWTYVLQNPAGNFYVGHTDNLENRIKNHNRTDKISGRFTRKNGPWTLVGQESILIAPVLCDASVKSNRGNLHA